MATWLDSFPQPSLAESDPIPPEDRVPFESGLEAMYRSHADRLLRFFSRRAGRADADDLVQETFARIAQIPTAPCAALERPGAYLTSIAVNLLRDRARVAARHDRRGDVEYDDELHGSIDPHHALDERETLARLDGAISRLNRRTREIFLLHRVKGLTYAEIADEKGMSVKGVKKQMAKALFELRRDIGPL